MYKSKTYGILPKTYDTYDLATRVYCGSSKYYTDTPRGEEKYLFSSVLLPSLSKRVLLHKRWGGKVECVWCSINNYDLYFSFISFTTKYRPFNLRPLSPLVLWPNTGDGSWSYPGDLLVTPVLFFTGYFDTHTYEVGPVFNERLLPIRSHLQTSRKMLTHIWRSFEQPVLYYYMESQGPTLKHSQSPVRGYLHFSEDLGVTHLRDIRSPTVFRDEISSTFND